MINDDALWIAYRRCLEPLLEIRVVLALNFPDCRTLGSNPAYANNFVGLLNLCMSPISLMIIAA